MPLTTCAPIARWYLTDIALVLQTRHDLAAEQRQLALANAESTKEIIDNLEDQLRQINNTLALLSTESTEPRIKPDHS